MYIQKRLLSNSTVLITLLLLFSMFFQTCSAPESPVKINPAFSAYISAFTSGAISSVSSIKIKLSEAYKIEDVSGQEITNEVFDFTPSIDGKAIWLDDRTIEFIPDEKLPSGTAYEVEFLISKLLEIPDDLRTFKFQFQTIRQSFSFHRGDLKSYDSKDLNWYMLEGTLMSSDVIESEEIEKVLKSTQSGKEHSISWEHGADMKTHTFRIDSIRRADEAGEVDIKWDGKDIKVEVKGEDKVEIPALGDFKLISIDIVQQPEQYVKMNFSDPLLVDQNLDGLIRLDVGDMKFIVEENEIRAYPPVRQIGTKEITIEAGIKNVLGYKMPEATVTNLLFEEIKPSVRLIGNGVILPKSDGLAFPFEAVNLNAVDLKIVKIYENNVAQFLQVNRLDGSNQLKRVGRMVYSKKVQLTSSTPIDYGQWNTFSIDLSKFIESDPGAVYKVELSFRKAYSMYSCEGDDDGEAEMEDMDEQWDEEEDEEELSYWDGAEDYYYDDYYDYNWRERDNPCHTSYYGDRRKVSRNVLASDLGIIAKGGSNGEMKFAVTDIMTTQPLSGVQIEIYNYQQQLMSTTTTDAEGFASISLESKPYLLIAKKDAQRGYLRLDDGSSLSLSKFDVGGKRIQKGIKGFIYGERGVWRPGDSLFVMFILEDEEKMLPKDHPVSFELIDPKGKLAHKHVTTKGMNGMYNFSTITEPDAPTGNWTANVRVGGALFSKPMKIETVKPNRLKILLDFGVEELSISNSDLEGSLAVTWLHGAIAKNLDARIAATLVQVPTSFTKYGEYIFDDPVKRFRSEEQTLFDGTIDENGKATIATKIAVRDAAPGKLRANFICRVFEESGDFSVDRFSIPYSPYSSFVGIKVPKGDKARGMLLTDTNHVVEVVTLDPEGNPVSKYGLEYEVYKVNWRWWWESSEDNLANYVGRSHNAAIAKGILDTKNGEGSFKMRVEYPEWGRYLVRVYDPESGHSTGKTIYMDWPGWAGRAQRENPGGASILSFSSDKKKYQVGEFASITFPASGAGRALVSIESGAKVVDSYWVDAQEGETTFNFKVTDQMAPNVFLNVTLLQPHAQTANDLPIRLYGVIPIMVEDPATKLYPEMQMPDVLVPEEEVTIKVKERDGKKMTYTLAIVDEGLLDLTRFKTPNPWYSFYAREGLGVKTWDMYDMVLGAYGGNLNPMLAIGGDGEGPQKKGGTKANRFKPMVKFIGPFELKSGGKNTHKIKMPRYVGSVRTMVVAAEDVAYGAADKTTPVRKPLMVLATLPRVVGPEEKVLLPVSVFAMEDKVKNVSVEIKTNEFFTSNGPTSKTIKFDEPGDQIVNFELDVASMLGIGKVQVIAKSGKEVAKYDIELDVRAPNPKIVDVIDGMINPGETWVSDYQPFGITGTNKGTIEVSSIPPFNLDKRLKYLVRYPHGCIEQTTSSVFPQLYLSNLMDLDKKMEAEISKNIKAGIKRLYSFQLSDGGLSYWPGGSESSEWGSNYAGHFLVEAKEKGYDLPAGFLKKWIKYQKKAAKNWSPSSKGTRLHYYNRNDLTQAYRLYTLAAANSPVLGAMNRLRESKNLSVQATWRLAAAYYLAGQAEVAKELVQSMTMDIEPYKELSNTFGSSERDQAMIIETLSLMGDKSKARTLIETVSGMLASNSWYSTQTTAYCLLAISKFVGNTETGEPISFTYKINKGKSTDAKTDMPLAQVDMGLENANKGAVSITNNSSGVLFASVALEGVPAAGNISESATNLAMKVTYKDMNGSTLNPERIEQGTDFMAEIQVKHPGIRDNYQEMALTQIFPSGWEIHNTRMDGFENVYAANKPKYEDIRDDRVLTYFDINKGSTKTYRVLLNAAYLGRFYLPTVYCEAMYDNDINARKPGRWVEVVPVGEIQLP